MPSSIFREESLTCRLRARRTLRSARGAHNTTRQWCSQLSSMTTSLWGSKEEETGAGGRTIKGAAEAPFDSSMVAGSTILWYELLCGYCACVGELR